MQQTGAEMNAAAKDKASQLSFEAQVAKDDSFTK